MKILVIIPITGINHHQIQERIKFLRSIAEKDTEIAYIQLENGPIAIESKVDHLQASTELVKIVEKAEKDGYDALISWCGGDPGVEEARTLVDIPVIGPGEAMEILSQLQGKRAARIHHPLPVLELRDDLSKTFRMTEEAIMEKIEKGYDSFYLDCLGMFGMGASLREKTGLAVIDGGEASLKLAELAVRLNLKPNRIIYPKYPPKHRMK
jgi:allantoin racemase